MSIASTGTKAALSQPAETAIFFRKAHPNTSSGKLSPDATRAIRARADLLAPFLDGKRVRIVSSPERISVVTAGVLAQALRLGQIEKMPALLHDHQSMPRPEAAIGPLFALTGNPQIDLSEAIVVVVDEVYAAMLPALWARERLRIYLTTDIKLSPCQARVIARGVDTVIPNQRARFSTAPHPPVYAHYVSRRW